MTLLEWDPDLFESRIYYFRCNSLAAVAVDGFWYLLELLQRQLLQLFPLISAVGIIASVIGVMCVGKH